MHLMRYIFHQNRILQEQKTIFGNPDITFTFAENLITRYNFLKAIKRNIYVLDFRTCFTS